VKQHNTSPAPEFFEKLAARLGPSGFITDPDRLEPHLLEWRGLWRGQACALVRPLNVEEACFVVEACRDDHVPITPQAGRTGLVGGGVPQGGIALSVERMKSVRSVDALNASLVVEAGITVRTVQDTAEAAGLLFPLSLASEESACIGGVIATNAGGVQVLRYGNMRDLVLGLEVVLPDGQLWSGLKSLRKDNAGYDLKQLFIGAEGTLGLITAASLKLYPRPKTTQTMLVSCANAHLALNVFNAARAWFGETLSAFEYWPQFATELVIRHSKASNPFDHFYPAYILIEVISARNDPALQEECELFLQGMIEKTLLIDALIAQSEVQRQAFWHLREAISEAQSKEGASIKHDVSVPLSNIAEFLEKTQAACSDFHPGLRFCAFGHLGDGNIHFNISQPPEMERARFLDLWPSFSVIVHDCVSAYNGSIAAEHGVGLLKKDELERHTDPVSLNLMRTLKKAFDPQGIFNPGKILF
jgi:FAD/FMN-containing dehydrogenase